MCVCVLFAAVHPLNVLLVVCFQLFALEFERVGDQARLGRPGLGAQTDLLGDLEPLQFRCWAEKVELKVAERERERDTGCEARGTLSRRIRADNLRKRKPPEAPHSLGEEVFDRNIQLSGYLVLVRNFE